MNKKQDKGLRLLEKILSYVLVAALTFGVTFLFLGRPSKLDRLERLLKNRFVGQTDAVAMEDAAAEAMVAALGDRWSYYIPAAQYRSYQQSKANAYVGIGVTLTPSEDGAGFVILRVEPDSPAAEAGILPGDVMTEANGIALAGSGSEILEKALPAAENTDAAITVLRDGTQLRFTVTQRKITAQVATGRLLPGNIGYISVKNFNTNCADQTVAAVDRLVEQGAEALIFDVRNNPGGYVTELVAVLDHLLPEGLLFRSEENGRSTEYRSDAACIDLPMAVLINGESYSAAEFFAAALSEYGWAVTVGEPTCGKSYYQVTYPLGDGSAVGLSIGQYYTPKGVSLAEVGGLVPEVPAETDGTTAALLYSQQLAPEDDPQLQAAIEALR